jgi:Grx4 family monothiol glutaredoxin
MIRDPFSAAEFSNRADPGSDLLIVTARAQQYSNQDHFNPDLNRHDLDPAVRERIEQQIASHDVVLYMKGTPKMPQCGFRLARPACSTACWPATSSAFNVLEDESIREGIKVYGNWPTIPQLYVKGELVGGCDIITEMFNAGELHEMLGLDQPDRTPPEIEITDKAADKIREFLDCLPGPASALFDRRGLGCSVPYRAQTGP